MNNKLLLAIVMIMLFAGVFTVFITAVYAKGSNLLCSKNKNLLITLKNEADINKSKDVISKIPRLKIIKITDRNKEWSKMVNKYDLPNMENPFKNEFILKVKKGGNIDDIYNKIKEMSFVENIKYTSDSNCTKE